MSKIAICMVGVIRPKLLEETMNYLKYSVLWNVYHEYNLYFNIDPVGDKGKSITDVMKVIAEMGGIFKKVHYNHPKTPSVVKAKRWVLDMACNDNPDYIFFKEDDIAILESLNLSEMIEVLEANPKLSSLHTDKHGTIPEHKRTLDGGKKIVRTGMEWVWNGKYYVAPNWTRAYSFLPSLTKTEFLREAKKYIRPNIGASPTNILKGKAGNIDGTLNKFLASWDYGYWTKPNMPKQIEDLGKSWKQKRGWKKPPKGVWKTWVK